MDNFTEGDRPPVPPTIPPAAAPVVTPLLVALILGVVALIVFCCVSVAALSMFVPPPN
jgi:hypothetical protein